MDGLIARARSLDVHPDHAHAYIEELGRWARTTPAVAPRRWLGWAFGSFALAATAIVVVMLVGLLGRDRASEDLVRLGRRVAIVADPHTRYRVVVADEDRTTIEVERGTVTARLFAGTAPYHLTLRGAGVDAVATGTIYSLSVGDAGAVVTVHEGKVAVRDATTERLVEHDTSWPPLATATPNAHALQLLHDARGLETTRASVPIDAGIDAPIDAATPLPSADARQTSSARTDAGHATSITPADATPSVRERWRLARLERGQGNYDAAVAACIEIADAHDATWSPIALLEAVRIELGPLAAPERAIELVDRFQRDWPASNIAPDARELRCRALQQLGKTCAGDAGVP